MPNRLRSRLERQRAINWTGPDFQALYTASDHKIFCESCIYAKATWKCVPDSRVGGWAMEFGGEVHSDVWGKSPVVSKSGNIYWLTFIDDYTRFTHLFFLKWRTWRTNAQYFTLPHRFQLDSMDSRWTSPILYKSTWSPGGVHLEFNNYCIFGVYAMDSTWTPWTPPGFLWSPGGVQMESGIFLIKYIKPLISITF
jgi:hypothetical protein